jgi:hypothetical protein
MNCLSVQTSFGAVPVWTAALSADRARPRVLVIRGAFADRDLLNDLTIAGAEVALVHLPGFHSPILRPLAVETFAAAYDEVVGQLFADCDVLVVGLSAGALAGLAMRSERVRGQVLVEPFFSTAHLWPLVEWLQADLIGSSQQLKEAWVEAIFGVTRDGLQDRDYSRLAALRVPTWALLGSIPLLPRRPVHSITSLTSDADRSTLVEAGAVLQTANSGHDVPGEDRPALVGAIRQALHSLGLVKA